MTLSGIYQIQSKIKPERIYIGSSVYISHRWNQHLHELRNNKHGSQKLQNHFNKYGELDLQFSVLLGCEKEDLIKTEQYFIDVYKPYFNIRRIADSNLGIKRSEETKKKISQFLTGRKHFQSQETKIKIGLSQVGKFVSKETRKKQSDARIGKPSWNKGRHGIYSDEYINKLKKNHKGMTGRKHSPETIQKMKDARNKKAA